MKIILKETSVDYKTYHFGYAINAILENEESIEKAYSKGFLPYTNDVSSILEEYYLARSIRINLKNVTSVSHIRYSNASNNFKDGTFIENKSVLTLGTDLTKSYDDYLHTINFDVDFILPKSLSKSGDLYNLTNADKELEPFSISETKKTIDFSINHSFYDKDDITQIINHKIKQSIVYDEFETKLSNLENEITFNHILGSFNNRLVYSQEDDEFVESSTGIDFEYKNYFINATHYSSKNTNNSDNTELESFTIDTGLKFNNDYTLTYEYDYNVNKHLVSKEAFSINIDDRCWNFDISFGKELLSSSSTTSSSAYQDKIYFKIELKQLGGINFSKKLREK